jgi:hypothetical protein
MDSYAQMLSMEEEEYYEDLGGMATVNDADVKQMEKLAPEEVVDDYEDVDGIEKVDDTDIEKFFGESIE